MNYKKLITLSTLIAQANVFAAGSINVQDRIKAQSFYLDVYKSVFGNPLYARSEDFVDLVRSIESQSKKKEVLEFIKALDNNIPEKILRPLAYWSLVKKDKEKLEEVISYYLVYKALSLRDYIDDPTTKKSYKMSAINLLNSYGTEGITTNNISTKLIPLFKKKAKELANLSSKDFAIAFTKDPFVQDFRKKIPDISPYTLSYIGIVPGNKVEVVSENQRDEKRIDWFNDRVIFNGGSLDFNSPYIKMPTKEDPSGHIVFKEDPIYMRIREMIDEAKDSVFIDIFLFGGTLGATLSEYLIDEAIKKKKVNPNFKVLLLHDYATNYNMLGEMMPIFEYIKKRIDTEPVVRETVMLMQANIQRHPPGIPFGITNIIPKNRETCKFMESKSTYYESKIDHSKVIVIDANTDNPKAYFGSKNWTDHSGGYYYDDAIYVHGPAAALVQASYYRDIEAALTDDKKELECFWFKEKGFDNTRYLSKKKEILDWFKVKKENYPVVGNQPMRIAEADVDGTIKNVRNILIDMISKAEKYIYMEQLFVYDPYINDALIKRKIQNPDLKIKILADHNGNFGMNGLPNTLFMKEMIGYDIEIRARKTFGKKFIFPNGHEQEYHQENHRKITSVDGKYLLGGSSNLNPDTLQGSFREFGAQIFDKKVIADFEKKFEKDWNNKEMTMSLDIENFQATIGGKALPVDLSELINGLGSTLYRNKDKIERRY